MLSSGLFDSCCNSPLQLWFGKGVVRKEKMEMKKETDIHDDDRKVDRRRDGNKELKVEKLPGSRGKIG